MSRTSALLIFLLPSLAACPAPETESGARSGDRHGPETTTPNPGQLPDPDEPEGKPGAECLRIAQRIADRHCPGPNSRRDPDPDCKSLRSDHLERCGKDLPSPTMLPLPPERLAKLSPSNLCDFQANNRGGLPIAGSHAHCVRGYEIAIELFGERQFVERAQCWLGNEKSGRPTVLHSLECGSALQFPSIPDEADKARAIAALQPWCAAKNPRCLVDGRCTASVTSWDAGETAGVHTAAGARVVCATSLESCATTPGCVEDGRCTPDTRKIGCAIASKADCAKSKACKEDGRCKFQKSDEKGWMAESLTRCVE